MPKKILITGASSGIGKSCAILAAQHGLEVIATARNKNKLQQLQAQHKNIRIIVADIASEKGQNDIAQNIKKPLNFLLHNAALLQKPQSFSELKRQDFIKHIATNVEPIIFLTQKLIDKMPPSQAHIICVSTAAAQNAIAGLGHYCISKAAALMATELLKNELLIHQIKVENFFPGVVDTTMQKTLRDADDTVFPYAQNFRDLKYNNELASPQDVAKKIIGLFLNA